MILLNIVAANALGVRDWVVLALNCVCDTTGEVCSKAVDMACIGHKLWGSSPKAAKTFSTLMSGLFLLFVQGVDLKYQPAVPGRAYKSKQLNMGASTTYRHGTQTPGTVPLLPSKALLGVMH